MKKTPFFIIFLLVATVMSGFMSCGPSAEEIARQDSIRVADSLKKVDSLRIVDSVNIARAKEDSLKMLRAKIDTEAAKHKGSVKVYDLSKIIYIGNNGNFGTTKSVIIEDVATGNKKTVTIRESADWGPIVELVDLKDNKHVKATLHCGGSGPFYVSSTIDIETAKASALVED